MTVLLFVLQVDYESEDEAEGDDAEDEEGQGEDESQENPESNTKEESQSESAEVKLEAKKNGRRMESSDQMRVNSVLQINSAIESYSFDREQELWCEVGCSVVLFLLVGLKSNI